MWPQSFYFIFVTAIVTTWAAFVRKVKHWQNCDRGYNLKPCAQLCKTKIQDITPWSWNSFRNWTLSTGGSPTSWQIWASSKHVLKIARNKRRKQDWKSHGIKGKHQIQLKNKSPALATQGRLEGLKAWKNEIEKSMNSDAHLLLSVKGKMTLLVAAWECVLINYLSHDTLNVKEIIGILALTRSSIFVE